ncbi:MAG: alanine--tRNA ligase [Clostridiaceae bacterium]|nr:alanine--tRNA ligase [Clostridiaceae bacterium]
MKDKSLNTIRSAFLSFFEKKEHLILPSFSLIPENDPSILLINAGMAPLKPAFTGAEVPPCRRIATAQKCIRTPDIERVGKTARHGTFFEMLGNFSFGDYFKEEAIAWGWEFSTEVLGLDPERIYVTVHIEDDEAEQIWLKVGVPKERIYKFDKSNFWELGLGPCGPCSEMFYDRGEVYGCQEPDCAPGCECDRFVEYWNLVFTQFDKQEDGSYITLKSKNIDTGAGLERIATIVQNVNNLFEVDTIRSILDTASRVTGTAYGASERGDVALRVITDHVRSSMMMIGDGIRPSNEGRGYVLRRLIRRASRHGRLLGIDRPFLEPIMRAAILESCEHYQELADADKIVKVLNNEEARFDRTLTAGLEQLQKACDEQRRQGSAVLPGKTAFLLHDTFGFPIELTTEIASEYGIDVDHENFKEAMRRQQSRARHDFLEKSSTTGWGNMALPSDVRAMPATVFTGYDTLTDTTKLCAILLWSEEDHAFDLLEETIEDGEYVFIFDRTPLYPEGGGQTGDTGTIVQGDARADVHRTEKSGDGHIMHHVRVITGVFSVNRSAEISCNEDQRLSTARNHTATHLLHASLQKVLGDDATQRGSYVSQDRLRFDFLHDGPLTDAQFEDIEQRVNRVIINDLPVTTEIMALQQAKKLGVTALFGEKYDDEVRVVSCGTFSRELCGGTHLKRTSNVLLFTILSESGIAAGVRRIEAVTGERAIAVAQDGAKLIKTLSERLNTTPNDLFDKVEALQDKAADLEEQVSILTREKLSGAVDQLKSNEEIIGDYRCIFAVLPNADAPALRNAGDRLRDRLGDMAIVVLAGTTSDKVLWLVMTGKETVKTGLKAGDLVRLAAKQTGGGGGGRPDMAQAGGRDVSRVAEAMDALRDLVRQHSS